MSMTVSNLHKSLSRLISKGHGRRAVTVAKSTFRDNRESDGCTILEIHGLGIQTIRLVDGDGFTEVNKDGSERQKTVCVLVGNAGANAKGEIVSLSGE